MIFIYINILIDICFQKLQKGTENPNKGEPSIINKSDNKTQKNFELPLNPKCIIQTPAIFKSNRTLNSKSQLSEIKLYNLKIEIQSEVPLTSCSVPIQTTSVSSKLNETSTLPVISGVYANTDLDSLITNEKEPISGNATKSGHNTETNLKFNDLPLGEKVLEKDEEEIDFLPNQRFVLILVHMFKNKK